MMAVADYWWWLTAGMVLMVLELVTPGVFFMWIGIGALITGLVAWIVPAASPAVLGTLFAILCVITVLIGKKVMAGRETPVDTRLNNRAAQYIGQTYRVCEPVTGGRGKISIGDTQWLAAAATDIPAGAAVKVVGARGTLLEVAPVDEH